MDRKNSVRSRSSSTKEHVIRPSAKRPSVQERTLSSTSEKSDRGKPTPRALSMSEHGTDERRPSNGQNDVTDLPTVNLAIIGAEGVGKSTFIQCALDLKRPPTVRSSAKKMSLEGSVYVVSLWKVSVTEISIDGGRSIIWPWSKGEQMLPSIDGVLVLFDATSPESVVETSDVLNALAASGLPFALVACKCDVSYYPGRPDPVIVEKATQIIRRFDPQETSWESPRTQKKCISLVLRSIVSNSPDLSRGPPPTPRILSGQGNGTFDNSVTENTPYDRQHRRAESASVGNKAKGHNVASRREADGTGADRVPSDSANDFTVALDGSNQRSDRKDSQNSRPDTPPLASDLSTLKASSPGLPDISPLRQNALRTTWRISANSDAFNSFLDMEEEADSSGSRPDSSSEQSSEKPVPPPPTDPGFTFDQLVDRLIALPLSKQDNKFAETFLCLYRKFAPPLRLLNALIDRFEGKERSSLPQLTRASEQLQLLSIVAQWTSEYPGDFAHPRTRRRIKEFMTVVDRNHVYMFAAKEISMHLEIAAEDDDVGWPFHDEDEEPTESDDAVLSSSTHSSPTPVISHQTSSSDDTTHKINSLDIGDDGQELSSRDSGTMSNSSSLVARTDTTLTYSATMHAAYESAQRKARQLELTPKYMLSKVQWRQFMDIPDDDFARELTRIDWIMFSSFRPRDLIRHVSISGKDKDKIKSLEHVNRMIKSFNHLAFFVASMVLLRDKPKHRAKALEKFMSIAQKLRRLNNYNSLGAVIAGINGTPVQRLLLTKDLIPPSVQKEFMRLIILMGTQKGHFAYRLAWENSFGERIPFLPLHRRDLVSAEEGNRTYVGENRERINWRKFDIMGEVVLGIQRSQRTPYPMIQRNEEVTRLVLDTKPMRDEEDLYSRSMQVEPSGGAVDPLRNKKFSWLRA